MFRQSYLAATLGVALCCGCAASASAQQSDAPDGFYEYARNKIGLLRYCRDQALLGQVTADRAVEAIEIALGRVAVSDDLVKERGERAQKAGQLGFWEKANGRRNLASIAALLGTTTADLCKELGGQTKAVQQQPFTRQVAPKVATSQQADLNANRSTASVKSAAPPPIAPTIALISARPTAQSSTSSIEPANPPAPTEVAASPPAIRPPFERKLPLEANTWGFDHCN